MDDSGNLYGTAGGGRFSAGVIFELPKGSSATTTLVSFDGTDGAGPQGLTMASNGNLYGTTGNGGASGNGTVFELAAGSAAVTTLASFNGTNGSFPAPVGSLVIDSSGDLYGTTYYGGASNDGTVFELAAGSGTITTLASFNGSNGANPYAGVVMDSSGNLYGTTYGGGASSDGTVFELAAGSGTITTLASFDGSNGANPRAGLAMDTGGNLYGTTFGGGASDKGTVFELAAGSGTITTLASFDGTDGTGPLAGLLRDANGNLYGTTSGIQPPWVAFSDGTVFEVAAGSGTITTLASFDGTDGAEPLAGLVMDGGGNLYGTTASGSTSYGTVFKLAAGSGTVTTLVSFEFTNGEYPEAGLVMDSSGNLYGTAYLGGTSDDGTVFELAAGSGTVTALASFDGTNGRLPVGSLIMDSSGNLYGTTYAGGTSDDGTVFELAAGSGAITTLASFTGSNGANPDAGLVMDSSGNLYGTTHHGGASNDGAVFELATGSGTITTLASFAGTDGANPYAALVMDSSGNLYGTTFYGGKNWDPGAHVFGYGTVFELAAGGNTLTSLASFDATNGANPYGGLIMGSSGNLYGTTSGGGASDDGTVFKLAAGSGTPTTLAAFDGKNGAYPYAGLLMDSSGNLYGTTYEGGKTWNPGAGVYDYGTAFEVASGSGAITTLVFFDQADGYSPSSRLLLDNHGNLYGATRGGGASDKGTVFELPGAVPDQWTGANFAVDTNWSDGANWSLGAPPGPGQAVLFTKSASVKDYTSTLDAGFTSAIGTLDIDSTWGGTIIVNSPLTVEGGLTLASGTLGGGGAVTIGSGQWTGGQIILGSGGFTNSGTFTADTTGGNLVLSGAGTLTNSGTIKEAGTNSLLLESSATLDNGQGATLNLTADGGVSQSGGGTLTNAGTLEKTGGSGTSTISSSFVNSGKLTVQKGALALATAGGTSTGGTFSISKGAKLDLTGGASVAYAGTYTGTGQGTVALDAGTLAVGTGGLTFNMAGSLFQWTGGTIDVNSGTFTNTGTINYAGTGNVVLTGAGSMVNKKRITQTSSGTWLLENGAALSNSKAGTLLIAGDGGFGESGGGTLVNAGTLEKSAGTGTSTIATTTLGNTGTVEVATGTLDISAAVSQVSGSTLTAGTWTVKGSATVNSTLDITSASGLTTLGSNAKVTLNGLNTAFTNLSGLTTMNKGAHFSLLGGQSFTTSGALANHGGLILGPGSVLTVNGSFTQPTGGTLTIELGGTDTAPTFGQLVSTAGTVTLAGGLKVTSTVVPAVGSSFAILDNEGNAAISGNFAGLPDGSTFTVTAGGTTMTFQITYAGTDADGSRNVIITRTS
jgi:uncharacterized repeat protein (TIGR03803 family)